ncbi:hypothetical protein POVWA2_031570 [Plasmodium ovale wallikeri]|uniref:Uncharacterized protein n=1 Tax=Plasmodium ovale wallikeri TaxID=864142 RepID=A0A1A8YXL3_PLAOA|nr:hypothetical protein POVWA1_031850 [Plasmodium ovale wallikeri]SBT36725.1 hypothetical protein POVWA2_031570 [Plasmodium ovale wallikeri]
MIIRLHCYKPESVSKMKGKFRLDLHYDLDAYGHWLSRYACAEAHVHANIRLPLCTCVPHCTYVNSSYC